MNTEETVIPDNEKESQELIKTSLEAYHSDVERRVSFLLRIPTITRKEKIVYLTKHLLAFILIPSILYIIMKHLGYQMVHLEIALFPIVHFIIFFNCKKTEDIIYKLISLAEIDKNKKMLMCLPTKYSRFIEEYKHSKTQEEIFRQELLDSLEAQGIEYPFDPYNVKLLLQYVNKV